MKTSIFSGKAAGVAKMVSFLFFSFLFFNVARGQTVPCGRISLQACTEAEDCFSTRFPFRFDYIGPQNPEPTLFHPKDIKITFQLVGDGVFDYSRIVQNIPGANVNQGSPTEFVVWGVCPGGPYDVPFTDCNFPIVDVYVLSPPGAGFEVLTSLETSYAMPGQIGCPSVCYDSDHYGSSDVLGFLDPASGCASPNLSLSFNIPGQTPNNGVYTIDPHQDVSVELVIKNNGTTSVTLSDLDLKLKVEDIYNTLPDVADWETHFVEQTVPENQPQQEAHEYPNHYFYFGSVATGTIAPGGSLVLLAFSSRPPGGLGNIKGEELISVEYLRVVDNNGNCCDPGTAGCTIQYPGELPCQSSPTVSFTVTPALNGGPGNCQSAFNIVASVIGPNGPTSVTLDNFALDFSTISSGNLEMQNINVPTGFSSSVNCAFNSPCPGGGQNNSCVGCTGSIFEAGGPVTLSNGAMFTVIFEGDDGTQIVALDITHAELTYGGTTVACAPSVDESNFGQFIPITNNCLNCQNIDIRFDTYNAGSLGDCQTGFSVWAHKTVNNLWQRVTVGVSFANPDNLAISVIPPTYIGLNTCPPPVPNGATPITVNGIVVGYVDGNYIFMDFCPSNQITSNDIPLFNVALTGLGCVNNAMFTAETSIQLSMMAPCPPLDVTQNGPPSYCSPCQTTTFSVGGNIHREDGIGIDVPKQPAGAGFDSGIFVVAGIGEGGGSVSCNDVDNPPTGPCDQVTSSADCTGDYNVSITTNQSCPGLNKFVVEPYKDINPLNGVTTYDMVLLRRHIIGDVYLDSPYKIIAADANNDGFVLTSDMTAILKLIIIASTEFPNGQKSWRFSDASQTLSYPPPPFYIVPAFTECVEVDFSGGNMPSPPGFVAVKIGDLNNSSECASLTGSDTEERQEAEIELSFSSQKAEIKRGEELEIDFHFNSATNLSAWQLGLKFDPNAIAFIDAIGKGDMDKGNFGLTEAKDGKVRALWYEQDGKSAPFNSSKVFTLRFKALQDIEDISGMFQINDEVLYSVAYEEDGKANAIGVKYADAAEIVSQTIYERKLVVNGNPNPFSDNLRLWVELGEASYVDITIFDAQGKVVATQNQYMEAGQQEFVFDKTAKWGKGVFTWLVNTDGQTRSGKVVKE